MRTGSAGKESKDGSCTENFLIPTRPSAKTATALGMYVGNQYDGLVQVLLVYHLGFLGNHRPLLKTVTMSGSAFSKDLYSPALRDCDALGSVLRELSSRTHGGSELRV